MSASSIENTERNCALCLDTLPTKTDSKVCKKCYEKHNNQVKYGSFQFSNETIAAATAADQATKIKSIAESLPEHYCNLCQKSLNNATDLEEHLIEHSFRGCEERGYNCYICSAIFTLPCGLHQHMIEHGPSYRPYDCNLCAKKFYFRAELENHVIDHENGRIKTTTSSNQQQSQTETNSRSPNDPKQMPIHLKHEHDKTSNDDSDNEKDTSDIQQQNNNNNNNSETNADDDDEYIEVEQIGESSTVNHDARTGIDTQHSESNDKYDEND